MTEIETLTLQVHDLGQTVDFWNMFVLWALAFTTVAAFVVGVSTRMVIVRTGQMSSVQQQLGSAKDRAAQADLKEKDRVIAVAAKGVVDAQGDVAHLQKEAAVAMTDEERARTALAAEEERAAKAEKALEEVREEVRLAAQPRELRSDLKTKLVTNLRPIQKVPIVIDFVLGNEESQAFAQQIAAVFSASGWSMEGVRLEPKFFASNPVGIGFAVQDEREHPIEADEVQLAFRNSGISVSGFADPSAPHGTLVVLVGTKASTKAVTKRPVRPPTFASVR